MKKFLLLLLLLPLTLWGQDNTPNVVNVNDSPVVFYNSIACKQKATVLRYDKSSAKDFSITVVVSFWTNVSGAYGVPVLQDMLTNVNLSSDQIAQAQSIYSDRVLTYTTVGGFVDATGNPVAQGTAGAQAALLYWQTFKVSQVPGFTSATTLGALAFEDLIITAIINKLNSNKKW